MAGKNRVGRIACETKCKEYSWCKGLLLYPHIPNYCNLLVESNELPPTTHHKVSGAIENGSHPLNKWNLELSTMGNMAEPNEWKNCAGSGGIHCFSKESKGMYLIKIFIYMTLILHIQMLFGL